MKKIIYIFTLVAAVILSGCSDFLSETNKSNPDAATFYKTTSGYESLINSCYSTLRDVYGDNIEMFGLHSICLTFAVSSITVLHSQVLDT